MIQIKYSIDKAELRFSLRRDSSFFKQASYTSLCPEETELKCAFRLIVYFPEIDLLQTWPSSLITVHWLTFFTAPYLKYVHTSLSCCLPQPCLIFACILCLFR